MPEQVSPSSVPIAGSVVQIRVWLLQLSPEIIEQVVRERRLDILDDETRRRLERAMERGKARVMSIPRASSRVAIVCRSRWG